MAESVKQMWVVVSGHYSDKSVHCVCDTQERAELIAATPMGDGLDAYRAEPLLFMDRDPALVLIYSQSGEVRDDGTTSEARTSLRSSWDFDEFFPRAHAQGLVEWRRGPVHDGRGGRLEVHGTDLEGVRATFSDLVAQLHSNVDLRSQVRFDQLPTI
jgi:hypothetical protein